jgi:hypothetical protein
MEISTSDIVILLVGALVWFVGWRVGCNQKMPGRYTARSGKSRSPQALDRTNALIRACYGDRKQADRLTQYEWEKFPGISRQEAVSRALDRLMDDRVR